MGAGPPGPELDQMISDLRRLRLDAGSPTIEGIARRSGLSKSTVADAFKGTRIPSERTLHSIVSTLGGNGQEWLSRRSALIEPKTDTYQPPESIDDRSSSAQWRRSFVLKAAVPLLSLAMLAGVMLGRYLVPMQEYSAERGQVEPETGGNIFDTSCVDDGVVIASETRKRETQFQVLLSYRCDAVWARVLRYDGKSYGNEITVEIYPKGQPESDTAQDITARDSGTAITTMIVQDSVTDEFCAMASMTLGAERIDLGDPICV